MKIKNKWPTRQMIYVELEHDKTVDDRLKGKTFEMNINDSSDDIMEGSQ